MPIFNREAHDREMRANVKGSLVQHGYYIVIALIIRYFRVIVSKQTISQVLRMTFTLHLID